MCSKFLGRPRTCICHIYLRLTRENIPSPSLWWGERASTSPAPELQDDDHTLDDADPSAADRRASERAARSPGAVCMKGSMKTLNLDNKGIHSYRDTLLYWQGSTHKVVVVKSLTSKRVESM